MTALTFETLYRGNITYPRDHVEETLVCKSDRFYNKDSNLFGPSGDLAVEEIVEERFSIMGASPATGTQGLFAADSSVLGFGYEIEKAIAGATSVLIGDNSGGDADRLFAAQTTYTAGTRKAAGAGAAPGNTYQGATADNVKLTWTGTGTGGGQIRVWVHRRRYVTYPAA